ncbi:hypothetical protein F5Y17DRAFT_411937 [Xylariaceae sp. FL0594]|nr:hypothetical protein F5Y17DRAFT_411937 [Xylariaceae sp. FL0594]
MAAEHLRSSIVETNNDTSTNPNMTCNFLARPLAGGIDSQNSQEKLLFLIRKHAVGIVESSINPDEEYQIPPASLRSAPSRKSTSIAPETNKQSRNASDAGTDDLDAIDVSPLIQENAIVQRSSAAPSKHIDAMSFQSPTQPNEGRSYEQYDDASSQAPSTPRSVAEDHTTLREDDTGYVEFKLPLDLADTAPTEPDTPFHHDIMRERSQTTTASTNRYAPVTPAMPPKPFIASHEGQLMGASQLFGQTQPTSGLRKPSPTSSRPSPKVYENNATSPTHPTSSPLINRGFGAAPLPPLASTSPAPPETSPEPVRDRVPQWQSSKSIPDEPEEAVEAEVDETPLVKLDTRRRRVGPKPIGEYRPFRRQDLDAKATKPTRQLSLDLDFEDEEAELRRQRARLNKQKASKSFPEISIPRSSDKSRVEVPSTSRHKQTKEPARPNSKGNPVQGYGDDCETDSACSQETVADSQDNSMQHPSTGGDDSSALPTPYHRTQAQETVADSQDGSTHRPSTGEDYSLLRTTPYHRTQAQGRSTRFPAAAAQRIQEKGTIPETSSADTPAELPKPIGDIIRETSSASSDEPALSLPALPIDASFEVPESVNGSLRPEQTILRSNSDDARREKAATPATAASSPSVVPESSQQSAKPRSARPSSFPTPLSMVNKHDQPSDGVTSSSAVPVLSQTPVLSSNVPSSIVDDQEKDSPDNAVAFSSPAARRGQRRRILSRTSSLPEPSPSLTRLKTYRRSRQSSRKTTRQSSRQSSVSIDELDRSPTDNVGPEARKLLRKCTTLREYQAKQGIFDGMVFAISMQERPPNQRGRGKQASRSELEAMIRQEGGKILNDGFSSLFDFGTTPADASTSDMPSTLQVLDPKVGFTALIADSHSRKVKYMQALALGIPCLAPRWVTTCVSKREVLDWSSYLLCAGSSMLLGDAIRSRSLVPYDASTAKLADVVSQRPKLLNNSRILLLMGKTKNDEKRLPYVFLARVLGADLVRVHTLEEARAKLREAEAEGGKKKKKASFDWVYLDDQLRDPSALFGSSAGGEEERSSKKRKRATTSAKSSDQRPLKRVRTLNDELVIQSLILGRLVEEDEMED